MRLPKLILALAVLATMLPGCADFAAALGGDDDPVVDASVPDAPNKPTVADCDRWHREAINHCHILFQAGDCYQQAEISYQGCLARAGAPTASPTPTVSSTPVPL